MKANPTKKQKVSISTAGTATAATDDDDGAWAGPDDNEPLVSALDEGMVQDEKYLLDKSRGQCDAYEKITTDTQPTQPSLATTTNNIIKTETQRRFFNSSNDNNKNEQTQPTKWEPIAENKIQGPYEEGWEVE